MPLHSRAGRHAWMHESHVRPAERTPAPPCLADATQPVAATLAPSPGVFPRSPPWIHSASNSMLHHLSSRTGTTRSTATRRPPSPPPTTLVRAPAPARRSTLLLRMHLYRGRPAGRSLHGCCVRRCCCSTRAALASPVAKPASHPPGPAYISTQLACQREQQAVRVLQRTPHGKHPRHCSSCVLSPPPPLVLPGAESYSPDDNRFDHRQFLYNFRSVQYLYI